MASARTRTSLLTVRVTRASLASLALMATVRLRTCWCGGQVVLPEAQALAQK
jgi:hypothetical protein